MDQGSLPGIIVFSTNESVITSTISYPRSQERILKVVVECYAKASSNANIILDNITAQVEELVAKELILPKLCKDCRLESTDVSLNNDGDQPVALANLTFEVTYTF